MGLALVQGWMLLCQQGTRRNGICKDQKLKTKNQAELTVAESVPSFTCTCYNFEVQKNTGTTSFHLYNLICKAKPMFWNTFLMFETHNSMSHIIKCEVIEHNCQELLRKISRNSSSAVSKQLVSRGVSFRCLARETEALEMFQRCITTGRVT